jgi:hypothetical protein
VLAQYLGNRQPDAGVAIMPTGMHNVRCFGDVVSLIGFLDGQSIHIGAHQYRWAVVLAIEEPDHACLSDPGLYLHPQLSERRCHDAGRTRFLKGQLWVTMEIAAALDHLGLESLGFTGKIDAHGVTSVLTRK